VYLKISGFRRFLNAEAQLHGRLIALVGPNEAGKSSLLDALEHLNSEDRYPASDISHEQEYADNHPVLQARFLLEDADRDAISHLPGGEAARWFVAQKRRGGTLATWVEPNVNLNLVPRRAAAAALSRLLSTKWGSEITAEDDDELGSQLSEAREALNQEDVISADARETMEALIATLDDEETAVPKSARRFSDQLRKVLGNEPTQSPRQEARRILLQRRPRFLAFSQGHRDLQSEYELADMDLENPPLALQNLADLAGLDLRRILASVQEGDYASPERPLEMANRQLRTFFEQSWRQSGIAVRLSHHETRLHVLISAPTGPYTTIGERSDGLRAFVALATFAEVHGHGDRDLVLLIDEAETHLHYNAQADLIQVLDLQQAASSVVYTTHSAGCLPEDLGSSVRVVTRIDDMWSEVQNAFWTKGAGFDPLLLGMGASALVFGAVRKAVIAEGATDLILLPTLLREATELASLGYQIAPGIAEVSQSAVADLELQASKAAYVVDNDLGGRNHRSKLRSAGVDASRIFLIGQGIKPVAIEDLVRKDLYLQAVNQELERSGREKKMGMRDIPDKGRSLAVRNWCRGKRYSEPKKVNIATTLALSAGIESPVLSPLGKRVLQELHSKLTAYFESHDSSQASDEPRLLAFGSRSRRSPTLRASSSRPA
jgi:predicted ATP-dependent endonuclease of OLD family